MPIVGELCLPGDVISSSGSDQVRVILGPGIRKDPKTSYLVASKPGILREKTAPETHALWLDTESSRYVPVKGDHVVGIVSQRVGDGWKLDIGSAECAYLSFLAFEGATKRNRPNVNIGDAIYCQVLVAVKDMEPEVVCVDGVGKARGMGVLPADGYVFKLPMHVVRKIRSEKCPILKTLAAQFAYEVTLGLNGSIYVKSNRLVDTIIIANAITMSEHMTSDQMNLAVSQLCECSSS